VRVSARPSSLPDVSELPVDSPDPPVCLRPWLGCFLVLSSSWCPPSSSLPLPPSRLPTTLHASPFPCRRHASRPLFTPLPSLLFRLFEPSPPFPRLDSFMVLSQSHGCWPSAFAFLSPHSLFMGASTHPLPPSLPPSFPPSFFSFFPPCQEYAPSISPP
jgi:hypothetical protein